MNPVAEQLTGWSVGEARGKALKEVFALFHETTRTPVDLPFHRVLEEGVVSGLAAQTMLQTRAGREFPIDDSCAPLRDEDDRITGVVIVFRDITAQRAAQQALHQTEERLRQAQKIHALGQLAGGVAHDFNNLMTVVLGYSELLLASRRPHDPDRAKLEQIQQAATHAATLTQQLLAFSRQQILHPQRLDLNALVTRGVKMLGRILGEDILLEMRLAPTLGAVTVDPVQLEQVLLNLAANARDAMPQGGTLCFSTDTVVLDADYAQQYPDVEPGRYALLAVRDTGIGMDQDTLARIFEPFFTTKAVGKGTGLGLATVYGIVKQSGGHITVDSMLGRGTTFTIYLPMVDEPAPASSTPMPPALPSGTETLLVVEDNPAVLSLVVTILGELGYTVLDASSSADALRVCIAHAGPIHLLLTDVVLPEDSGPVVAERLLAVRPGLKVLYMSGYAEAAIAGHGVLGWGAGFLSKPFTPMELAQKVRAVLETSGTAELALGVRNPAGS